MLTFLLYVSLSATLYYLGAHARITEGLHRRYPAWLTRWAQCPACSGTWYGLFAAATVGRAFDLTFLGLPGRHWATPLVVGLCATCWTPIAAYVHIYCIVGVHNFFTPETEPTRPDSGVE